MIYKRREFQILRANSMWLDVDTRVFFFIFGIFSGKNPQNSIFA